MRANQKDELLWPVTKAILWINGVFFLIGMLVKMIAK